MPRDERVWIWRGAAIAAALLFAVLAGAAARRETPTIDEYAHLPAGCAYWKQGAFELYDKNPPLGRLWMALPVAFDPSVAVPPFSGTSVGWAPWRYADRFRDANRERYFDLFLRARLMVVLLGLATGALVYFWARALFDERAAAVSAALFLLSPPILAHAHLATVDVACMLTIFLACFALRWAILKPESLGRIAVAGLALGAALAMKFTALLVVPAFLVLLGLANRRPLRLGRFAGHAALLLVSALLLLPVAYGFHEPVSALGGFQLHSSFCRSLQRILPSATPVPLPRAYVEGFDAVKLDTESGEFDTYLRGQWSREGWWYYNLVALGVKTPIPVLVLGIAGIFHWRRAVKERSETWLVLLPAALLFVFLSLLNKVNTGVRYVLPLYPFLHLAVAAVLTRGERRLKDGLAVAALVVSAFIAVRASGDSLAYFNLIAGGPKHGHEWLLDSNLDWGQDLYRVPAAVAPLRPQGPIGLLYFGHVDPALYGIDYLPVPARPVEAVLAVSASFVAGQQYLSPRPGGKIVWVREGHLAWLRAYQPVAKAGTMWIYDTRRR